MIILAFADIHGDASCIHRVFKQEQHADVALLLGDITNFGNQDAADKIIAAIEQHGVAVLGVHGNCDYAGVGEYLRLRSMSLHARCIVRNGMAFFGAGFSLPCPGRTPGEIADERFAEYLAQAAADMPDGLPSVMVTHEPPFDTCADLAFTDEHVGSRAIRSFIEQRQPLACFCGHIHEGAGLDRIGDTIIVNPGPLRRGRYGWACIEEGSIEADIRNF
jgi:hypothetical protein